MKLTLRQAEVLSFVRSCGVVSTGYDGSVLVSLEAKGLVARHYNNSGRGGVYYTWTLTESGKQLASKEVRIK